MLLNNGSAWTREFHMACQPSSTIDICNKQVNYWTTSSTSNSQWIAKMARLGWEKNWGVIKHNVMIQHAENYKQQPAQYCSMWLQYWVHPKYRIQSKKSRKQVVFMSDYVKLEPLWLSKI
jgi:hypothetical protein